MSYFSSCFTNLSASNLPGILEKLSRTCLVIPITRTPQSMEDGLEYTGEATGLLYAVCIHRKHILLIGFDELPEANRGSRLADEEEYQNEVPQYFSESGHRASPVYLMKQLRSLLSSLSGEKYEVSILLVCNYPIINVEDMQEEWEDKEVWVVPSCQSIKGLKTGLMDQLDDEALWAALLQLYDQSIPDLLKKVCQEKNNSTEDTISETEDTIQNHDSEEEEADEEDEFEKLLNDFIASELEEDDSEDSQSWEKKKADIPIKGTWREMVDKESALYQSLVQLGWEVAYGDPDSQQVCWKQKELEWVAWPDAKLWIRATATVERDSVLFDYIEGAAVYLVDHGEYVIRKKMIRRCDIWKDKWTKVCLGTLPEQGDFLNGEWIEGEIRIVKGEVELAILPIRWSYLPGVFDIFHFNNFQLYRNVSSMREMMKSTALSCFAKKGLRNISAVYQAERIWEEEFPAMFHCRLYGEVGKLLAEKYVMVPCPAGTKELTVSVQWGKADGITWKKGRYLMEWRFRDEVIISAIFEVGRNDIPGIYQEDEVLPEPWDRPKSASDSKKQMDMDPWEELEELVGMDDFKQRMKELASYRTYMDQRIMLGVTTPLPPLHMAFIGGTASRKMKVAKLLGRILHKLDFLKNGEVTYTDWEAFVQKNSQVRDYESLDSSMTDNIRAADGGILFLDRVFPPPVWDDNNGHRNVPDVAWASLMSQLRNKSYRNWVLVISGSESMVKETVAQFDELSENIPLQNWFHFADYTHDELMEAAHTYCIQHHYRLSEDAAEALRTRNTLRTCLRTKFWRLWLFVSVN